MKLSRTLLRIQKRIRKKKTKNNPELISLKIPQTVG
jgi:hypothetical protein